MVKSNIQYKSSATNAHPPGPQATSTSVDESSDSLNLISRASSRAGKRIHPRGCSCARRTVRRSSRSVSAAEDSRKASPELLSPLLPLRRRKVKRRRSVLVPGHLLSLGSLQASSLTELPLSSSLLLPLPLLLKGEHIL